MRKKENNTHISTILIYLMLIIANLIVLNIITSVSLDYTTKDGQSVSNRAFQDNLFSPKLANNDTTPPTITFINPPLNNSIITEQSYNLIINVTDDNPPLPGNVIIQISNYTSFLFNATMNNTGGDLWSFNWDNISLYPNREIYISRVWAKDNSSNENYGWSEDFYIYLNISTGQSPSIITIIFYILAVSAIFALIRVYLNRAATRKLFRKKKKKSME